MQIGPKKVTQGLPAPHGTTLFPTRYAGIESGRESPMRTAIYILASMGLAGLATAGTHGGGHTGHTGAHLASNASNHASNTAPNAVNTAGIPNSPPGIAAPVRQPTIPPPSATPMPPPGVTPPSAQFTQPAQPTQPMQPGVTIQPTQPMHPSQMTDQQMVNSAHSRANNAANFQQRVPAASRGVGNPGKPDCSRMRGIDKAECERRDTVRDDLPAGVTTTQPER